MLFSILLLVVIVFLSYRASPREREEDAHVHGGADRPADRVALFGVDYFTSYFYATGEMMHALHPYGLQKYGYLAAGVIALANLSRLTLYVFWASSTKAAARIRPCATSCRPGRSRGPGPDYVLTTGLCAV
jgi:hypothetical protein